MKELIEEIQEVFYKYGIANTYDAVEKIVNEWYENKSSLIELFSKHKNWEPQKFFIHFDMTTSREVDMPVVHDFFYWVHLSINFHKSLNKLYDYDKTFIDLEIEKALAEDYPVLRIKAGMKTSKATRKILCSHGLNTHPDWEKRYARYSDAVNPLEIVRHTVISLNPVDYLLMSNGNSWTSCHTIADGGGDYCSGTLSYMMDSSSIVVYQVDKEYDGNDLELQPKIIRQMFHYKDGVLIQGRLYPQTFDGRNSQYVPIRAIMQSIIAEGLGVPNLWRKKGGSIVCSDYTTTTGKHYPDYEHRDDCNVSRIIEFIPLGADTRKVPIGHESYCVCCGDTYNRKSALHCCDECEKREDYIICTDCGRRISEEEEVIWINGEPYCDNCTLHCDHCERYHRLEDVNYYSELGKYVCDRCVSLHFTVCDNCGDLEYDDNIITDVHGRLYCCSCAEHCLTEINGERYPDEEVNTCDICGEVFVGDSCPNCEEVTHEG